MFGRIQYIIWLFFFYMLRPIYFIFFSAITSVSYYSANSNCYTFIMRGSLPKAALIMKTSHFLVLVYVYVNGQSNVHLQMYLPINSRRRWNIKITQLQCPRSLNFFTKHYLDAFVKDADLLGISKFSFIIFYGCLINL